MIKFIKQQIQTLTDWLVCIGLILVLYAGLSVFDQKINSYSRITTIVAYSFEALQYQVEDKLADDWQLHGEVQVQIIMGGQGQRLLVVQVMKK